MDTTEKYFKMCEMADDIQNIRYPDFIAGDWYISHNGYPFVMGSVLPVGDDLHRRGEIWLPTQDQLQDMIKENLACKILAFTKEICSYTEQGGISCSFRSYHGIKERYENLISMEQLWLAFVMQVKYNKIWEGEKWICKN